MPSPFPGMDPCLEHPASWPGVHQRFIGAYARRLDYRSEPTPTLEGEDVAWAAPVLQDRGLRS